MTNAEHLQKCLDAVKEKQQDLFEALKTFNVNYAPSDRENGKMILSAIRSAEIIMNNVEIGIAKYESGE